MIITRRNFGAGATALAASSVLGPVAFAKGQQPAFPAVDPATLLDPELRPIIEAMATRMKMPPLTEESLKQIRSMPMPAAFLPKPLADPPIVEKMIPGRAGAPDVKVLVIGQKADGKTRPAVLYIHGGGYILGSPWAEVIGAQTLAVDLDCVVVMVDYRLAPETRFPGSLEDNYAGLQWLHTNADSLGVDRKRIALFGGSAGGGHAAALAIAARDRGEIPICYQVLIYPMLDDHTGSTRMPPPFIGTYGWSASDNRLGWTSLLGVPAGSKSVPKGSVPSRVEDLSRLPPAFIGVGALDLFVEEDMEYAQRLVLAGVPTKLLVEPGAFHGFDQMAPQSRIAKEFTSTWKSELATRFAAHA
jgi:acetyl esterase/lipase